MGYQLVPSLTALRAQINATWSNRDRESDGWVGDTSHSRRRSDHNPDTRGWVHALDVDKDGIDTAALLSAAVRDRRVNYVIFNRKIYSRVRGFRPAAYTGPNPHDKHLHISVLHGEPAMDGCSWNLPALAPPIIVARTEAVPTPPAVIAVAPPRPDPDMVRRMQRALHVADDGHWGRDTDFAVNCIRVATQERDPARFGVGTCQRIVGAHTDGKWGPRSQEALRRCVVQLQHCWGVRPDGDWGVQTMAACGQARTANFRP